MKVCRQLSAPHHVNKTKQKFSEAWEALTLWSLGFEPLTLVGGTLGRLHGSTTVRAR